jgi:hypothetical protein
MSRILFKDLPHMAIFSAFESPVERTTSMIFRRVSRSLAENLSDPKPKATEFPATHSCIVSEEQSIQYSCTYTGVHGSVSVYGPIPTDEEYLAEVHKMEIYTSIDDSNRSML